MVPCIPPSYHFFESVQQNYHVRFASAIDIVGRHAGELSTRSLLQLMQWVSRYQVSYRFVIICVIAVFPLLGCWFQCMSVHCSFFVTQSLLQLMQLVKRSADEAVVYIFHHVLQS